MCARAKGIFPSRLALAGKKKDLLVSRQRALCYFCSLPNMHPCIMGTQGGRDERVLAASSSFSIFCARRQRRFFSSSKFTTTTSRPHTLHREKISSHEFSNSCFLSLNNLGKQFLRSRLFFFSRYTSLRASWAENKNPYLRPPHLYRWPIPNP